MFNVNFIALIFELRRKTFSIKCIQIKASRDFHLFVVSIILLLRKVETCRYSPFRRDTALTFSLYSGQTMNIDNRRIF